MAQGSISKHFVSSSCAQVASKPSDGNNQMDHLARYPVKPAASVNGSGFYSPQLQVSIGAQTGSGVQSMRSAVRSLHCTRAPLGMEPSRDPTASIIDPI